MALAESMNQRAPMAIRVNGARVSRDELTTSLAEEHVIGEANPPVAGRVDVRDAGQCLRALGVPRRAVRGDGRREPAGRRAGGAAARGPGAGRLRRGGREDAGAGRGAGGEGAGPGARHRREEAGGAAPSRPARRPDERRGEAGAGRSGLPRPGRARHLRPGARGRTLLGGRDAAPQSRGPLAAAPGRRSPLSRRASWR